MNKAPIILSVTALVLSITALSSGLFRNTMPLKPRAILAQPDQPGTGDIQPCEGSGLVDSLQLLMRNRVNPTMTRLSFALYHDDRPKQDRLGSVAEAAAVLLGCVDVTPSYRPEIGLEGLPDYYRLLERMQANLLALQTSAREMDEDGTRHWFSHLKHDCNECHARFRISSEGDVMFTESGDDSHAH